MSKIINSPIECGHRGVVKTRLGIFVGHFCTLDKEHNSCNHPQFFPDFKHFNCPLEDGLPKKSIHWP